jgi:hypothetical protein
VTQSLAGVDAVKAAGDPPKLLITPHADLAAPEAQDFETPLCEVELSAAALAKLDALAQVVRSNRAHKREHSLEFGATEPPSAENGSPVLPKRVWPTNA